MFVRHVQPKPETSKSPRTLQGHIRYSEQRFLEQRAQAIAKITLPRVRFLEERS